MPGIKIAGVALVFPVAVFGGRQRRRALQDAFTFRDFRDSLTYGRNEQLVKAYGLFRTLLLLLAFSDALDIIDRITEDVLREKGPSKQDGAMRTRDAMCAKYNMTAVAAAILAQVAITALSLDHIDSTHWTAQAGFIISLVAGSLSVFYCCMIQMTFGTMIRDEDIKHWLCKPSEWEGMEGDLCVIDAFDEKAASLKPCSKETLTNKEIEQLTERLQDRIHEDKWKTPSINAVMMLTAPARLLYLAVVSFLTGLGIYLGFVFSHNLVVSTGKNASLANLIIYLVEVVLGVLLFYVPFVLRQLEHATGQKIERGARLLKIMLDIYEDIDKLVAIRDNDDSANPGPHDPVTGPHLWNNTWLRMQDNIRLLYHDGAPPSQVAMTEVEIKLNELAKRLKYPVVVDFPTGDVSFTVPGGQTRGDMMPQDPAQTTTKTSEFAEKVRQVLARQDTPVHSFEELRDESTQPIYPVGPVAVQGSAEALPTTGGARWGV